jgi:ketosteroid isomerase-like protein
MQHEAFIAGYERVRHAGDSDALGRLWHPDGWLHHPSLGRRVRGSQLSAFDELVRERLPDLSWELSNWAAHGDVVYLEWTCRAGVAGRPVAWSGVDRITMRGEKIAEQVVYCDTMPLWAAVDRSLARAALLDAGSAARV